jgi:murein L,D-transpeptidase YafK
MRNLRYIKALVALLGGALCLSGAVRADGLLPVVGHGVQLRAQDLPLVTRVAVHKAERRMDLMRGEEVVRSFRVSLGLVPSGHKERAGDFRTPEGRYRLTRRNSRSDYFLSIQVSYPSDEDRRRARRNGWDPGGSIMIHGLPNMLRHPPEYYFSQDWTDGCIALSNSDMVELWMMTQDDTRIEIQP